MKKLLLLGLSVLLSTTLAGCNKKKEQGPIQNGYGVLLGANEEDIDHLLGYKAVCIDIDEFSLNSIQKLKDKNIEIYAYLSIGSLEKYRSYYQELKDLAIMEYTNWHAEFWVDVSDARWQSHINSEVDRFIAKGADGIFMDNFDVYYFVNEEYENRTDELVEDIYDGCKTILNDINNKDTKLMINSGTDFLERLSDEEGKSSLDCIDVYAQESVFSTIEDYCEDEFGVQEKYQQDYLFEMIDMMRDHSEVLLIEYTVDKDLIKTIQDYCAKNNFYYYISDNVGLGVGFTPGVCI